MTDFIDRDELRKRLMDDTYLDDTRFPLPPDAPILDDSERIIQSTMLGVLTILEAMPMPSCETCRRGDDDQGKDQCRGTLLREASVCNFWEARP